MTMFTDLSTSCISLFSIWSILLNCMSFAGIVLSVAIRRYRYAVHSFGAFAAAFVLWQVICNLTSFDGNGRIVGLSVWMGQLPWLLWAALMAVMTACAVLALLSDAGYARTFITPLAIKYCGDRMGCGICYYRDNGHIVFSNRYMNRIAGELTGNLLRSGVAFVAQLTAETMTVGDRVWKFSFRDLSFDGEPLHEIVAIDVTEVYEKAETLKRDNRALSSLNNELKAYSLRIDDTVRREEILQAKVNIHDEMNRLMMTTAAADCSDKGKIDQIFTLWQRDAVLLCMEAEERKDRDSAERLRSLASALNIRLNWNGEAPASLNEEQREVFYAAAREAVTNAGKHAEAKNMEISVEDTEASVICRFINDGKIPTGEVRFTGGLANLALLAEDQHAAVRAEGGERFILSLIFQKNF